MNFSRFIAHSLRLTTAPFVNPAHHIYFLFALLLFCPIAAIAQGTPPSWVQAFGSSGNGANTANSIKAAPDHSLYVGGQFTGTATFGGTTIAASGALDIFLAKYSPSGSLLWIADTAQQGGPDENIAGNGVDLDADGNVYMTGEFYGDATFYSASAADKQIKVASGPTPAIFFAKYNPSGALFWVQTVTSDYGPDTAVPMIGKGLAVNAVAGTVYLGCVSQANLTFSSADGSSHTVAGSGPGKCCSPSTIPRAILSGPNLTRMAETLPAMESRSTLRTILIPLAGSMARPPFPVPTVMT